MVLDLTKWATSSDGDLVPGPVNNQLLSFVSNRATVTLRTNAGDGPILYLPPDRDLLDVRLERTTGGKQERRLCSGQNLGNYWDLWANAYAIKTAYQAWYSEEAIDARYFAGGLKSFTVEEQSDGSGTWTLEISTPYYWGLERDVAELMFAWLRFYTPQGSATLAYLDRDALVEFSAIMTSHFVGSRFFEFRRVGKTVAERVKDLSRMGRTMLGWGGYQAGSSTVQQLGLRALAREERERETITFDLAIGRDEFLTGTPDIRTADELIVNQLRARWGSHTKIVETIDGGYWDPQLHSNTLEEPSELIETTNELYDEDATSVSDRGARLVENEMGNVVEEQVAMAIHRPWLWIPPKRIVRFEMGPLHLDFDPGAIISASEPSLGLDGTEDLLVISKKLQRGSWGAEITAAELEDQLPPAIAPNSGSINATLGLWLEADTGVTLDGGGNVTTWADQSGQGNNATYSARVSATLLAPRTDFLNLNGKTVVSFNYTQGTDRGLDLNGMTTVLNNSTGDEEQTWMFLCRRWGQRNGNEWLFSVDDASATRAEAGIGYSGSTSSRWAVELDGNIYDALTQLGAGEFVRGSSSHSTVNGPWYILVVQKWIWGSDRRISLHQINNELKVQRKLDLFPTNNEWDSLELEANACLGCKHDASNGEGFMGLLAAVAAFAGRPDPKHVLGVARWWINKWGPIAS
jgi:hypothetical protein